MEIVSFLKMWMDVWNEAEEKGLKMPEEAGTFQKKETKHDEVMKEINKFLPRREFSAENGNGSRFFGEGCFSKKFDDHFGKRTKCRGKHFFYRGKKKEDCCQYGSH